MKIEGIIFLILPGVNMGNRKAGAHPITDNGHAAYRFDGAASLIFPGVS